MIPRGENAARFFFEGLPEGEAIPWGIWVVPLSFWYGFSSAQLRHDLHHGHSTSPVDGPGKASLSTGPSAYGDDWPRKRRSNRPVVFSPTKPCGSALPYHSFCSVSTACTPTFRAFPRSPRPSYCPCSAIRSSLNFWFSPPWTGFFYFVNLDITASIWIFYTLTTVQRGIFNIVGLQSTERIDFYSIEPFLAHQGMGSMIVFVLVGLWVGRGHLQDVYRKAFHGDEEVDDSGEMLSYRQALFGLLAALALVVVCLCMMGLTLPTALLFIFGAMMLFIGLTRVVAEGGIPAMRPPIMTSSFVISGAGASALGASGLVALGFSYGWHSEVRSFVMSSVANGLKMGEIITGSKRRLFWAVVIAIVVSLVGSSYMTLVLAYKYGGINLNPLFFVGQAPTFGPRDMAPRIAAELPGPRLDAWLFIGIGGGVMALLMWARHQFVWWPLNPLGYTISANWKTGTYLWQRLSRVVPQTVDSALRRSQAVPRFTTLSFSA